MNPFRRVVGNEHVTSALTVAIEAAQREGRLPGHILLSGPAGTGKTKFSEMIAESLGSPLRRIHAPGITRRNAADLTKALITLDAGAVLFIDEIHALPKESMEGLYEALEQQQISLTAPTDDGGAKIITIPLNPFVLVGATTDPGRLIEPLLSRFKRKLTLTEYTTEELVLILQEYQDSIETPESTQAVRLSSDDLLAIAQRSRGRARNALKLFGVCRDHLITGSTITRAFEESGLGSQGQTNEDVAYVSILRDVFHGGPVGLGAMVSASGMKAEMIERVIEPFLIKLGIIRRTPRGRMLAGDFA